MQGSISRLPGRLHLCRQRLRHSPFEPSLPSNSQLFWQASSPCRRVEDPDPIEGLRALRFFSPFSLRLRVVRASLFGGALRGPVCVLCMAVKAYKGLKSLIYHQCPLAQAAPSLRFRATQSLPSIGAPRFRTGKPPRTESSTHLLILSAISRALLRWHAWQARLLMPADAAAEPFLMPSMESMDVAIHEGD